jgi:hypothetical protein
MAIAGRLKRLESVLAGEHESDERTFGRCLGGISELDAWRETHGYPDFLSAQEAGETGPEGLEDLLKEYATYDRRHRAWARIESSLTAGSPPDGADVRLIDTGRQAGVKGKTPEGDPGDLTSGQLRLPGSG